MFHDTECYPVSIRIVDLSVVEDDYGVNDQYYYNSDLFIMDDIAVNSNDRDDILRYDSRLSQCRNRNLLRSATDTMEDGLPLQKRT